MSKMPQLQNKISTLVHRELKDSDPIVKELIIELLHNTYLERNKTTNNASRKLEEKVAFIIEEGLVE